MPIPIDCNLRPATLAERPNGRRAQWRVTPQACVPHEAKRAEARAGD